MDAKEDGLAHGGVMSQRPPSVLASVVLASMALAVDRASRNGWPMRSATPALRQQPSQGSDSRVKEGSEIVSHD